jgi:transcription initiation factor TFIIH subunit 3
LAWHNPNEHQPLSFHDALDHVLVFLNAHLALKAENQLAVYAASITTSHLLYSSLKPEMQSDDSLERDANTYAPFRMLDHQISEGIKDVIRDLNETMEHGLSFPEVTFTGWTAV